MGELNLLAICVGNSRTRVGAFVEGKLTESATYRNVRDEEILDAIEHAFAPLAEREDALVLMSSDNPPVSEPMEKAITQRLGREVLHVERDVAIPIGRQLDPETIVGQDRLLSAAAAYDVLKQACVVVDAGTAITVDLVDGAGTFHGGAIGAGAQTALDALTQRAALLPPVEFAKPLENIGHNTVEAMRVGVYHGLRGMVRELVEQYAERLGAFPPVIATGGDGDLLFRDSDLVDRVVPDLILLGMAATVRRATEETDAA